MIKVLANDGIHEAGKAKLEAAGYQVDTEKIPQDALMDKLPEYDVICVRSATKIRQPLIDVCPNLKAICRGGVGLDNIDVDYAKPKGIAVYNTPAASSRSVAELVIGHLFTLARHLHHANRAMPATGNTEFKALKKQYSKGFELGGKTLGIIGAGRIGRETAKLGIGLGMHVIAFDPYVNQIEVELPHISINGKAYVHQISNVSMNEVLEQSDFISIHVPSTDQPLITRIEMEKMRPGVCLINAARGGSIHEADLLEYLNSGHVAGAALDVFNNEPTPDEALLSHANISMTPHTGASTKEAQMRIGIELADAIINHFSA